MQTLNANDMKDIQIALNEANANCDPNSEQLLS